MLTFRRPILAAPLLPPSVPHTDENILAAMQRLKYPVLATIKLDGIRALRLDGSLLSRTRKKIPNKSIRERSLVLPGGFDMELWSPDLQYNEIESIVMSEKHPDSDKIQFHILDWFGKEGGYWKRCIDIRHWEQEYRPDIVTPDHNLFDTPDSLLQFFLAAEKNGTEGICFRLPNSPYKQGRSTLKEQYLVKLARFHYSEVTIVGFQEQLENCNEQVTNSLGLSERSSHGCMQIGKQTLGAFICQLPSSNVITIGTGVGLTDKLRAEIWHNKSKYLGRTITFKHKLHGEKDLPRSPVFVGFREKGF